MVRGFRAAYAAALTRRRLRNSTAATEAWGTALSNDDRLNDLSARLEALKASQEDDAPHVEEHYSMAQIGWRMVIELVAGLGIGFGMGYGLDSLLGTIPIFLVLFTLLGLAAGIKVMLNSAQEMQKVNEAAEAAKAEGPEDGG